MWEGLHRLRRRNLPKSPGVERFCAEKCGDLGRRVNLRKRI